MGENVVGFSTIIEQKNARKQEQLNGHPKKPLTITLANVEVDYNNLINAYNNINFLSKQGLIALQKECAEFYLIIERLTRSNNALPKNEQTKLYAIFLNVKNINKQLQQKINIIDNPENY